LFEAELADGSSFLFRTCYLPQVLASIDATDGVEDQDLGHIEEEDFRFASSCFGAEQIALRLIARAEQTAFGLGRKLEKRGFNSTCVRAVIARLCELDLLDDRRYARFWLELRLNWQATSPTRLLTGLRSKGIDREDAGSALREALDDETELRLLERFLQKHQSKRKGKGMGPRSSGDADADTDTARRSLKYMLRSEGFSSLAIETVFDE